jgi:hypothetical protein
MYRPREEYPDRNTPARQEASRVMDDALAAERAALVEKQEQLEFESAWTSIIRTPIGDRVVQPNEANKSIIRQWSEGPGEGPASFAWFQRVLEQDPHLSKQLVWDSTDKFDPVKRQQANAAQSAQDRQTFADACRQLHIGDNEANFGIIRETLGEGFSVYQVQQAVQSGAVRLALATREDIAQWAQEAVEERNEFLLTADNQTLRNIARREGAKRRATAVRQEADRQFQTAKVRDTAIGYPALPETWRGQQLNAAFIRSCDVETHKLLTKRFGSAALTARLRGN